MIDSLKLKKRGWIITAAIISGLIILNWLSSNYHIRLDLTNEKRFTISSVTKEVLRNLDSPISVDVLLKGNYPSGFRNLASSTEDILQEFKEIAGRNLTYRFIKPDELMEGDSISYADFLNSRGSFYINLTVQEEEGSQQQLIYPVAIIRYKDKIITVRLFKEQTRITSPSVLNSAEAMLEYNLTEGISLLMEDSQPSIGYLIGNGEPMLGDTNTYDLLNSVLIPKYNGGVLNLNELQVIPEKYSVILMVKPTITLSASAQLKLDQYLMRGGRLLIFMDRLNAEEDTLKKNKPIVAFERILGLDDLLFRYGARVKPNLLMDLQCDFQEVIVNGEGQRELILSNYYPVFASHENHPINKGLGFISGKFVNTIDTIEVEGVKKTILLSSSENARILPAPALISLDSMAFAPKHEKFNKSDVPVAVLLEGEFRSLFANRLSREFRDSLKSYGTGFLDRSRKPGAVLIVSDGDMVLNQSFLNDDYMMEPMPMGMNYCTYNTMRYYPFANREFLMNCLDYLSDKKGLSELKAKDYRTRLLNFKKVKEEKFLWQMVNIAVPIILVFLFAVLFAFIRKRRYAKIKSEANLFN